MGATTENLADMRRDRDVREQFFARMLADKRVVGSAQRVLRENPCARQNGARGTDDLVHEALSDRTLADAHDSGTWFSFLRRKMKCLGTDWARKGGQRLVRKEEESEFSDRRAEDPAAAARVREALGRLAEEKPSAFIAFIGVCNNGMTCVEVAAATGLSTSTVHRLVEAAREFLREYYRD